MTCWIAIPIKDLHACKARLRPALDDREREHLVRTMLRHVTSVVSDAAGDNRLFLLSPAGHDLPGGFERFADNGEGLNSALDGLMATAAQSRAGRLVIVPADLPLIAGADMQALTDLPPDHAAIATDRAGLGTNALSLPLPAACDFAFQFGADSFAHHRAEARRLAIPLLILGSERLAFDIDEPADLIDWREQFGGGAYQPRHANNRQFEAGDTVGSK